jgi:hypothetical protein
MTMYGVWKSADEETRSDPVLGALSELDKALDRDVVRILAIRARISDITRLRAEGESYREIVAHEERPLIVEMATDTLSSLFEAGSRLRKAEARALHDEGLTMTEIGELFGVSRQRISELLRADS